MAVLNPDEFDAIDKVAIEAAKSFTDWYYQQISSDKPKISIAHAYTTHSAAYKAIGQVSDIVIGGSRLQLPEDLEWALAMQRRTFDTASVVPTSSASASSSSIISGPSGDASPPSTADRVLYRVESLDVHVANADYRAGAPPDVLASIAATTNGGAPPQQHERLMLLVYVDGFMALGRADDAPTVSFAETFVLVPNWEVVGSRNAGRNTARRWLVLAQNFRRRG